MCKVLGVRENQYYRWQKSEEKRRKRKEDEQYLVDLVVRIYEESNRVYGCRKIHREAIKTLEIFAKDKVKNCSFEKIVLNVDGVQQNIKFSTPIKHTFSGGNVFTEALQIAVIPNDFSSKFINNEQQCVTYEFNATEDVVLQGIRVDDFISATNVVYAIGQEESHNAKFPISLKKGENIKFTFSFKSTSNLINELSYVATNIYFDYLAKSDNKKHFNSAYITFDPIFPISDNDFSKINKIVDSLI